ncbi:MULTISPECIES: cupin domain-containing protein [unclassified Acetobacterium]|jgi:quercetin dioxygenase-like cupin family protein|uniref:cupin domain-containing protein n=1 Tax=unclassified Acetobacterium TaxID=2638182 RepID=UPI000DBEC048|nr:MULTISPECIES: cupin domain-containing protein [unclassified Acetobacterium]AWW27723.1 hypothetical protein DOZ58_14395 [Acetobacterium sp. KB-1]MDZ5725930.1 cupin domain-containing protein [Acetobacterium sp. K1/6]
MKMKLPPTVIREIQVSESECALVRMTVKAGTIPPLHAHPQAQIDYMISGCADVSVDGIITHLEPGDAIYIPGGVTHGFLVSEEDQEFLEFFTPGRDDLE